MKNVSYTQVWGMVEWMEQNTFEIGEAFNSLEQIAWLAEQGYRSEVSRHYEPASDNFHVTMTFEIPESVYTFLILKWPEEIIKVDFMGPTIKETRI